MRKVESGQEWAPLLNLTSLVGLNRTSKQNITCCHSNFYLKKSEEKTSLRFMQMTKQNKTFYHIDFYTHN